MTRYQGLLAEILEVFFDSKTAGILLKKGDVFVDVLYFFNKHPGQYMHVYIYVCIYTFYALKSNKAMEHVWF